MLNVGALREGYVLDHIKGRLLWSLELRNWKNVVWWTETESIYHWMW